MESVEPSDPMAAHRTDGGGAANDVASGGDDAAGEVAGGGDPADDEAVIPSWATRIYAVPNGIMPLPVAKSKPPSPALALAGNGLAPKSGILNIDKPAGRTSHDVVQAVRRASGEQRVGHAGTLDPMATGVLVVCLGSATRVVDDVQAFVKGYRARITLGSATDTYDAMGQVTSTGDAGQLAAIGRADVEAALVAFRGEIAQVPPMVSALKHEGKRLYELARRGIEVERAARSVTVHALDILDWSPPDVTVDLLCSRGTYVRSIAHDLGAVLGVGGHLSALERTRVGPFTVDDATSLARVVEAFMEGWYGHILHPLDTALVAYPAIVADDAVAADMRAGRQFDAAPPADHRQPQVRVYHSGGAFVGMARWDAVTERWQPSRVFPPAANQAADPVADPADIQSDNQSDNISGHPADSKG
ncbi:MAG: tRNA pseudouridine(55) synthase TruB [Ardenticatenales bacterium]|nr:tRNA pseudouridine(55) synthase TruB [Ardenticatenales bacterium]